MVSARTLTPCTDREKEWAGNLLNEGDLIISGKMDGECAHNYLLHRQKKDWAINKWGKFDYQFYSKLAHNNKYTNKCFEIETIHLFMRWEKKYTITI
jgi:hypothetical protein